MRTLAIHLPQFHPIPENDKWWGKGFTEWTNVTKALPLFRNHYQPRLPADLGFVDMRLPEARAAQARLASNYGIDGFCYYHYWFEGQRLIERPVNEILKSPEPDFPFSLCWANETWSRRWMGEEKEILIKQTYSAADHERHALWLSAAFADPRYIRVNGKPLFLIYRPMDISDLQASLDIYRRVVTRELGCDAYLVAVDSHRSGMDFRQHGFDHTMNFTPQLGLIRDLLSDRFSTKRLLRNMRFGALNGYLRIVDYAEFCDEMWDQRPRHDAFFPSVFVGWDNTARRGRRGVVVANGTPEHFQASVLRSRQLLVGKPIEERILFVNAWNEWAEGNHLEPDRRDGHGYLRALKTALDALLPA